VGDDFMDGGAGNDQIRGDVGSDTLIGGSGNDSFIFNNRNFSTQTGSIDTVGDFSEVGVNGQDTLRFEGLTASQLTMLDVNGGVLIAVNRTLGSIVINSFSVTQLWDQIAFS
jgi:Ca2+-binding RTX toxin-like protein